MNKKRAHIFTAEKPNMQLSRIISAITFIFARQNGYEVVDVIADYNSKNYMFFSGKKPFCQLQ